MSDEIMSDILSELTAGLFRTPLPSTLPSGSVDITFQYAILVKLDDDVRNLRHKDKSDRTLKIRHLKASIPGMKREIRSARADVRKEEREQVWVVSQKVDAMNEAFRDHGPKSKQYEEARSLVYKAKHRHLYYEKTVPDKIKEYEAYLLSCEGVLDSWSEYDSRPQLQ